jgi:hypothetical protein
MASFESPPFSATQDHLSAIQAKAADLRQANEELAGKLVEVTHLCDESAD